MPTDADRAQDIFRRAAGLADPAARAGFVADACGPDTDLQARVEALLAAHAHPETVTHAGGADSPTGNWDVPAAPTVTAGGAPAGGRSTPAGGRVVGGKYTLVGVIGEGGMGSVYLARQTEPVKREVAVKLIRAGFDSRGVLARFDAERQALALMEHPNIARVYDGGTTPDGLPFFAMELVRGQPITRYCDEHRIPLAGRLDLFVQVCRAVQHAHQKGIIHRDLKPGNILVTEVDGKPTPKVIDFGVAKATEQKLTDLSFSDLGAVVGTPVYMSPEQADPTSADIDTRTDVYALGVVLYELLTGTPPLRGKDLKRGAILEMLRMIREVDPPHPSTRASSDDALPTIAANRALEPGQLLSLLRGDIDAIVMKAIDKDRDRRYDTANGFAADILRYLGNEPVAARVPTRRYRLRKFVRRNRAGVAVAAAFLVLLAGGAVAVLVQWREADRAKRKAEANYAVAMEQRQVSFDAIHQMINVVNDDLPETPGTRATQRKVLSIVERVLTKVLGNPDADIQMNDNTLALVYEASAQLHLATGDVSRAADEMRRAIDVLDRALGAAAGKPDVNQDQAKTRQNLALFEMKLASYLTRIDPPQVKAHLDRARELFGDLGPDAPADYRYNLARHYRVAGATVALTDPAAGRKLYEDSLRVSEELVRDHREDKFLFGLVDSYRVVGRALVRQRDPAAGERYFRQGVRLADSEFAKSPVLGWKERVGYLHDQLGDFLLRSGKPAEARAEYVIALNQFAPLAAADPHNVDFGDNHSRVLYSLGLVELRAGNNAVAAGHFKASLAIREARVRVAPEREAYIDLMWSLARDGRPKEAADMADLVLKKYGSNPVWLVDTACCFALCAAAVPADKKAADGYAARAVRDLTQAVALGYRDAVNVETEPDLDAVRGRPDFQAVMADLVVKTK